MPENEEYYGNDALAKIIMDLNADKMVLNDRITALESEVAEWKQKHIFAVGNARDHREERDYLRSERDKLREALQESEIQLGWHKAWADRCVREIGNIRNMAESSHDQSLAQAWMKKIIAVCTSIINADNLGNLYHPATTTPARVDVEKVANEIVTSIERGLAVRGIVIEHEEFSNAANPFTANILRNALKEGGPDA